MVKVNIVVPPYTVYEMWRDGFSVEVLFDTEVDLDNEELMDAIAKSLDINVDQMDWRDEFTLWVQEA